ncbi:MAG: hypothetical protein IPM43_09500 [Actinomycetota bacterium]|nr:MAG: hypothetical protein IPM43_09500 [Actinomycetota bacterium]
MADASSGSDIRPFGISADTRSLHPANGAAAAMWSGVPSGLVQGLRDPSAFITRSFRVASWRETPAPSESPVTPTLSGIGDALVDQQPHCVLDVPASNR